MSKNQIEFIVLLNNPHPSCSGQILPNSVYFLMMVSFFLSLLIWTNISNTWWERYMLPIKLFCSEHRCPSTTLDFKLIIKKPLTRIAFGQSLLRNECMVLLQRVFLINNGDVFNVPRPLNLFLFFKRQKFVIENYAKSLVFN